MRANAPACKDSAAQPTLSTMKHPVLKAALALGLTCAAGPAFASPLVNIDTAGVAIQGYDPVAYFADGKPVKGDEKFQSEYAGAKYDFASAAHKAAFDQDPSRYAPQFGGFCAYGVSQGHAAPADPTVFQIVDGRLLLQYSGNVSEMFNRDKDGNLKKADANWSRLGQPESK